MLMINRYPKTPRVFQEDSTSQLYNYCIQRIGSPHLMTTPNHSSLHCISILIRWLQVSSGVRMLEHKPVWLTFLIILVTCKRHLQQQHATTRGSCQTYNAQQCNNIWWRFLKKQFFAHFSSQMISIFFKLLSFNCMIFPKAFNIAQIITHNIQRNPVLSDRLHPPSHDADKDKMSQFVFEQKIAEISGGGWSHVWQGCQQKASVYFRFLLLIFIDVGIFWPSFDIICHHSQHLPTTHVCNPGFLLSATGQSKRLQV